MGKTYLIITSIVVVLLGIGLAAPRLGTGSIINRTQPEKLPDLVIERFEQIDGRLAAVVKNIGTATAPSTTVEYFNREEKSISQQFTPALEPGQSATVSPAQNLITHAIVDYYDTIREQNEDNNETKP